MTAQEQLRDLLKRHCASLLDQVEILDKLISQNYGASAQSSAPIAKAQNITHQIKGTSGSMGFLEISCVASKLDDKLKLLAKQDSISQLQLRSPRELLVRLRKIAGQATPQKSTLYDADLASPGA